MEESGVVNVPEQGQIVTVRQRRYVVTDVLPSTLPPSPLAGRPQTMYDPETAGQMVEAHEQPTAD